jgi:hypothetical protein
MLEKIKKRCGIAEGINVYNEDISDYIEDALEDMKTSGVPPDILQKDTNDPRVLTAVTLYVKAYLGNDRSDTRMYLDLYRKKVFRMTLEGGDLDVE